MERQRPILQLRRGWSRELFGYSAKPTTNGSYITQTAVQQAATAQATAQAYQQAATGDATSLYYQNYQQKPAEARIAYISEENNINNDKYFLPQAAAQQQYQQQYGQWPQYSQTYYQQ